jgi:radical SAM superfamily enzyme YgiQ (UPF0313 family)
MRILLVSTYELGHQPLHVASPAAALERAGHQVHCLDLSVQQWEPAAFEWAEAVAFSVPMHTAMRLAMRAAAAVRRIRPGLPLCLYGLYAPVSRDQTVGRLVDRVIGGEYEPALVSWADALASGAPGQEVAEPDIHLERSNFELPARHLLPPLDRYAHLALDGGERPVGYVEASHGCAHLCRHCPVPAIYGGRIRITGRDVVLDDIDQLVAMGARHITFGDPDFLNGWRHSLRVVRAMHERHPELTFDCTTKVEHVLQHKGLWEEFAAAGCLFVVSALESVNDDILELLDKGHTTLQAVQAIELLRGHRIEIRPSFLPFTPWTTLEDVVDIMDFVLQHDLIANVDPIQYSIRLLLPEGSLLLEHPAVAPHLGPYDPEHLTYTWVASDPRADELQARLAALVARNADAGKPIGATYLEVYAAVRQASGYEPSGPPPVPAGAAEGRPRLTEPWFC